MDTEMLIVAASCRAVVDIVPADTDPSAVTSCTSVVAAFLESEILDTYL